MGGQLIASIADRMRRKSTEELLKVWVENDQEMWSADAFEAIQLVLAERKVDLPKQDAPVLCAPVAELERDDHWLRWLKGLLIVALIPAASDLLIVLGRLIVELRDPQNPVAVARASGLMWLPQYIAGNIIDVGVPFALLLGIICCWRCRPVGRWLILAYAWASIGLVAIDPFWLLIRSPQGPWFRGLLDAFLFRDSVHRLVLPVVLLLFITRPQIRRLFEVSYAGFEVGLGIKPSHEG